MEKATILIIESDQQTLNTAEGLLRQRFGQMFRIVLAGSGQAALQQLQDLKDQDVPVALLLVSETLQDMPWTDFISRAREVFPHVKVVLNTNQPGEQPKRTDLPARIDASIGRLVQPAAERYYPILDDLLSDWFASTVDGRALTIQLIGSRWSSKTHEIKDYLARCQLPVRWLDIENNPEAKQLYQSLNQKENREEPLPLPLVLFPDGAILSDANQQEIARQIGLSSEPELDFYDLVIVGGGPAGLSAAVYAGSEGLRTLLVEKVIPGGQAALSARIENYLGFPSGIRGSELAQRAVLQAQQFGVEILSPRSVTHLWTRGNAHYVRLDDGTTVGCHAIILAMGVKWRRLDVEGIEKYIGKGVYYGSTVAEARACVNEEIYIVGGANSAGQAAVFFAKYARQVTLLVRGDSLVKDMSEYLIEQIDTTPNIQVRTNTEVVGVQGEDHLEAITIKNDESGNQETLPTHSLFVFIGASPAIDWLGQQVERDERGYILAGADVDGGNPEEACWPLERSPFMFETSLPGVFVIGDVRHGSVKRVASAVGQGSVVVHEVHQYLQTI